MNPPKQFSQAHRLWMPSENPRDSWIFFVSISLMGVRLTYCSRPLILPHLERLLTFLGLTRERNVSRVPLGRTNAICVHEISHVHNIVNMDYFVNIKD